MLIQKIRRWRACQKKTRKHYVWAESYRSGEKRKKRKIQSKKTTSPEAGHSCGSSIASQIGIGTTGVGGPKRIVEMVEGTVERRDASRVNVKKEETKDTADSEEEQVYQQIKDELGI